MNCELRTITKPMQMSSSGKWGQQMNPKPVNKPRRLEWWKPTLIKPLRTQSKHYNHVGRKPNPVYAILKEPNSELRDFYTHPKETSMSSIQFPSSVLAALEFKTNPSLQRHEFENITQEDLWFLRTPVDKFLYFLWRIVLIHDKRTKEHAHQPYLQFVLLVRMG